MNRWWWADMMTPWIILSVFVGHDINNCFPLTAFFWWLRSNRDVFINHVGSFIIIIYLFFIWTFLTAPGGCACLVCVVHWGPHSGKKLLSISLFPSAGNRQWVYGVISIKLQFFFFFFFPLVRLSLSQPCFFFFFNLCRLAALTFTGKQLSRTQPPSDAGCQSRGAEREEKGILVRKK